MTEQSKTCDHCDHRRQEPLEINGKMDIAWFCEIMDIYVPTWGYCHWYSPAKKV